MIKTWFSLRYFYFFILFHIHIQAIIINIIYQRYEIKLETNMSLYHFPDKEVLLLVFSQEIQ